MSATDSHAPTEPLAAEVVTEQPAQPVPSGSLDRANAVIDAAANAAAHMPGVPGRDEFLGLAMQARMLSMSAAAPEAVQNNPALAFHVAMVGRDLGISPSAALELVDVIKGKGGRLQLSLSPQLLNAQVRRLGLGEVVPATRTERLAVAVVVGPRGLDPRCRRLPRRDDGRFDHVDDCACDVLGDSEFGWEDARMAGLVGAECQPGTHKRNRDGKCGCNQGYQTYPKRMLWWRAAGFATDDYFPEAGLGLYSPEELGAVVDEQGRPIDPATVELPPGYEQRQGGRGSGSGAPASPGDPGPIADATKLRDLQVRILSLPDALRAELKQRWAGSNLAGYRAAALPESKYGLANSMVLGYEARARTFDGWDQAQARQDAEETIAAQEAAAQQAAGKTAGQTGGNDKMSEGTEAEPSGTPTPTADAAASTGPAPTDGASPAGPTSPPPSPSPAAAAADPHGSEPGPPPTPASGAPSPSAGSTATPPTPVAGTTLGFDPDVKAVVDAAPPEVAKATLDRVNALSPPRVGEELARLSQPLAGNTKERRRRLVAAYLLEAGVKPPPAAQDADPGAPVGGAADAPTGPPAPS